MAGRQNVIHLYLESDTGLFAADSGTVCGRRKVQSWPSHYLVPFRPGLPSAENL